MSTKKSFEIDDGAHEVVDERPLRDLTPVDDITDIAVLAAGGHMARMRAAGDDARRRFILMRTQKGAVKMALAHVPVMRAILRGWAAKRVQAEADPGLTPGEIAAAVGVASVTSVLLSLVRNGALRRKTTYRGWQGKTTLYYPSDLGKAAIGIAELTGEGSLVQVGGLANAWTARNLTEPPSIFQFADLIKGGLAPETV